MKRQTYSELIDEFKDLDEYILRLGLKVKPSDRVHQAIGQITKVNSVLGKPEFEDILKKVNVNGAFVFSHTELAELASALEFVKTQDTAMARLKLEKILKGPLLTSDENTTNNEARNTVFELNLGSLLSRGGFKVKLKENPDLVATKYKRNYFIQAKRVYSENGIEKNINEAYTQLKRDLIGKDKNTFGVIAISITRAITDGNKLLEAGSEKSGLARLSGELLQIIDDYKHCWKKIPEKNIIAVILHISCTSHIKDEGLFSFANYHTLTNIHDEGKKAKIFPTFRNDFFSLIP